MRFANLLVGCLLLLVLGCSTSAPAGDAGGDSEVAADRALPDVLGIDDVALDAAPRVDVVTDGAPPADALDPLDVRADGDTGAPLDGAVDRDAARIDGAAADTGVGLDAEPADARGDAGFDAAAMDVRAGDAAASDVATSDGPTSDVAGDLASDASTTTCSVSITPTSGTTATSFTLSARSNGTGCSARVDGGGPITVACDVAMMLAGSFFGAGTHTVVFAVSDGPSGPTSCSGSFVVTAASDAGGGDAMGSDASTTTCAVSVSPASGATDATFVLSGSSNGSGCSASIDGGAPLVVPCTASTTLLGSTIGVGMHTVVLLVGAGPSGATSCGASFTVTAPPDAGAADAMSADAGTTTCSITVTPVTGTSATSYTFTAASNGSGCAARIDGGAPISVGCTASMMLSGSLFGVGTHSVEFAVASGPSGATSCTASFEVTP